MGIRIVFALPGFWTDTQSAEGRAVRRIVSECASKVGRVQLQPGAAVFSVDRAFRRPSSAVENAKALEALMNTLVCLDAVYIQNRPRLPSLYESGVFYHRTEVWDTLPSLYARGWGDCKSLAALRVVELRRQGVWCRPVFRFDMIPGVPFVRTGSVMYHILVMFADGRWEDPSKVLGMNYQQEKAG